MVTERFSKFTNPVADRPLPWAGLWGKIFTTRAMGRAKLSFPTAKRRNFSGRTEGAEGGLGLTAEWITGELVAIIILY
jgi:hypothetical protein